MTAAVHLHDELIEVYGDQFCECGDGPFTPEAWDVHRHAEVGVLPEERIVANYLREFWPAPISKLEVEARAASIVHRLHVRVDHDSNGGDRG